MATHQQIDRTRSGTSKRAHKSKSQAGPHPAQILQRLESAPGSIRPADVLTLQRTIGNRATGRILQAKLKLGPAGDQYEQEADRVAKQVVHASRQPEVQRADVDEDELQAKPLVGSISQVRRAYLATAGVQREGIEEEEELQAKRTFAVAPPTTKVQRAGVDEEELQAKPNHGLEGGEVDDSVARSIQSAKGGGAPLHDGVRRSMERGFGADFGGVRVHTGGDADVLNRSLNARAFTTGNDIFFGKGQYNPGSSGGQELIAHELTHTVQQGAAGVQRHPSHAEEEEVQAKSIYSQVQRHPGHAEEEELQAKRAQPFKSQLPVMIIGGLQRNPFKWMKKKVVGNKKKEQALTTKYGIQIGPGNSGGSHFSDAVLKKLDNALSQLPIEHLQGTYLKNISSGDGIGAASAYTQDSDTAGHIGIVAPGMPEWIYAMLNKGVGWQRKLMDSGAIESLTTGVSKESDKKLGIENGDRQVFAGVSDVLSNGNLLSWTVRHEMGHAVDHKIKWTKQRAMLPQFGGWRQYDENNVDELDEVASALLEISKINQQTMKQGESPTLLDTYRRYLKGSGEGKPTDDALAKATEKDKDVADKFEDALTLGKVAKAAPWQLPDGGASRLELNGRVYHQDHYDTWVSYLKSARDNHGLSNYQFSSPGEWFAEAYAAFYDPADNSPARDRMNDASRNWFLQNLGAPPKPGQTKPAPPALDSGTQQGLKALAALGKEMLDELKGQGNADIDNVPDDLKSDKDTRLTGF